MMLWAVLSAIIWLMAHIFALVVSHNEISTYKNSVKPNRGYLRIPSRVSKEQAKQAQTVFKLALWTIWLTPFAFITLPVFLVAIACYGTYKGAKNALVDLDEVDGTK
jgi:hypothetical protein